MDLLAQQAPCTYAYILTLCVKMVAASSLVSEFVSHSVGTCNMIACIVCNTCCVSEGALAIT